MSEFNGLLLFVAVVFWIFCAIFIPIFIFQIRNATIKTNKLLQQLIDQTNGKPRTLYDITGLLGDKGID